MTAPDRPASSRRRYSSSPFALRPEAMRRYMRAKNGLSTFSSAAGQLIDARDDGRSLRRTKLSDYQQILTGLKTMVDYRVGLLRGQGGDVPKVLHETRKGFL